MSATICSYPFAHQHIDPDGSIKYCCNSHPPSHMTPDGKLYNIKTHTLKEAWNSDAIRQLRLDLIAGKTPDACQGCWNRENSEHTEGSSMRLNAAHHQIPIKTIQDRIDYAQANDGMVLDNPHDFQIMSGNLCNLACKMCGPRYSNTWSKFFKRHGYETLDQISFGPGKGLASQSDGAVYIQGDQDWPITNPLNTIFPEYYADIKHIFLTGGEPTLITENIEFLEELVRTGHSRHIELRFSTNLTNINKRLLSVLDHFGRVGINMSLDGMDHIAYIQRTPSNWGQILQNADYLMDWFDQYRTRSGKVANVTVNTVVSALNIHHVLDLWRFLANRYTYGFHLGFTPLTDKFDNYYIGRIPKIVINQLLQQLDQCRNEICQYRPGLLQKLKSFEYHLREDIYQDNYQDIQLLLNGIQSLHPELNIKEIYRIYYPDAV